MNKAVKTLLKKRETLEKQLAKLNKQLAKHTVFRITYFTDIFHKDLCEEEFNAPDEETAIKMFYEWQDETCYFGQGCNGYYRPHTITCKYV